MLVVTDPSDPKQAAMEKQVASVIQQFRARFADKLDKKTFPVLSYHFNAADERNYCEQTLGIHRKDLVFLAVVEHKDEVIKRLVYHAAQVQDPQSEGYALFKQVCHMLGLNPALLKDDKQQVVAESKGLAFNQLYVVDGDGNVTNKFKTTDPQICFNVFVQNLAPDKPQSHRIEVDLVSPDGTVYGRPLGGMLTMQAHEDVQTDDVLRRVDIKGKNGFAIKDQPIASVPGQYKVRVMMDGKQVAEQQVSLEETVEQPAGNGQLGILQCFIGDDQGVAKDQFITKDTGAFVFIILKNLQPDADTQQHTLTVQCVSADGKPQGRPLGGSFTVEKGEDLSKKQYPGDADTTGSNGILIRDQVLKDFPGDYKFVVSIDGDVVREMPFTLKP